MKEHAMHVVDLDLGVKISTDVKIINQLKLRVALKYIYRALTHYFQV